MRSLFAALLLVATSSPLVAQSTVYVRGYMRQDGTYVPPHYRTAPNHTKLDNYSSSGNVNPYTGREGTRDPYALPSYSSPRTSSSYRSSYSSSSLPRYDGYSTPSYVAPSYSPYRSTTTNSRSSGYSNPYSSYSNPYATSSQRSSSSSYGSEANPYSSTSTSRNRASSLYSYPSTSSSSDDDE